jgi:hypothetical protein
MITRNDTPRYSWKSAAVLTQWVMILMIAASGEVVADTPAGPDRFVNCDRGESLAGHLRRAEPGTTVHVRGTCFEHVTITMDRITLDGHGTATIDGGGGSPTEFDAVLTIDGARGVVYVLHSRRFEMPGDAPSLTAYAEPELTTCYEAQRRAVTTSAACPTVTGRSFIVKTLVRALSGPCST